MTKQDKQFIEVLLDRVKQLTIDNYFLQQANNSAQRQNDEIEKRLHSLSDRFVKIRGRNLWNRIWNTIP